MSKYVQDWMPKDERLQPFYKGIESFLNDYLKNEKLDEYESHQSKIIADPLLGYIHFSKLEVAIIDTKLFQRLRKITQLGLAYLVFPSLGYSRFEHSLGVVGRLNQVVNKLLENNLRNNSDDNLKKTVDKYIEELRLAALLHDVGHCLFSHCSERIIEKVEGSDKTYPSAKIIQEIFTKHFSKETPIPFAEIFAISIVGSHRFYEFIAKLGDIPSNRMKSFLEHSGRFILGLPCLNDPHTVFLAQLISSGLDADKIDYMIREQHYSGIKLEIDLDRILSKLQVFELDSLALPKNLQSVKKLYTADKTFKVLGFGKGGQFAFEEFCVARLALHVKVYLHQKVRAAESQLSIYLEDISKDTILQDAHNWLALPESVIEYPEILLGTFNKEIDLFNAGVHDISKKIEFKKIDERNIYFRAFAFGPINSFSEGIDNQTENKNLSDEFKNFFDSFKNLNLKQSIIDETKIIAQIISFDFNPELLNEILVDIPRFLNIQQGQESIYFERPNLIPLKWTIPIDKIIIYFQENRALAYIFAPKEIAHIVALAAEKIVFDKTKKVYNQEGNISKNTFDKVLELKKQLTQDMYYQSYPQLKQVSDYLRSHDAAEKIQSIYEKLAAFKSLNNNERITINRITTFVNQFPDNLQDICLSFLKHLEIYNESLLVDELNKVIEKITNDNVKIGLTYLGGAGDSGERFNYYMRTAIDKFGLDSPAKITDNLIMESDILVVYDDNINSGKQLLNIFAELLSQKDKLPSNIRLNEKHISSLSTQESMTKLLNMPIYFVYIIGTAGVENKVKKQLHEFLKFHSTNIHISINKILTEEARIFSGKDLVFNHEKKKEFKEFLEEKGRKLLLAEGRQFEKAEAGKLGYAGAEAMVLFPYNIPTMTITALWCKGEGDGIPWIPLAERRRRMKNGVLSEEE
jgi:HD superfamily phosphohydrolase